MSNSNEISPQIVDSSDTGSLVVIATPIGNMGDISSRAIDTLSTVDVIACEDTRHTGALCARYDIKTKRISLHEHNEAERSYEIIERIQNGETVALVSDAGTPGISDPGHLLIKKAIASDIKITAIPGPVAAIDALILSGLPTDRFCFEGFLPRKNSQRQKYLEELKTEERTMVFYVAPHRQKADLEAMCDIFGEDRNACLARELTKKFEEIIRKPLGELARLDQLKGEIVVVIEGASENQLQEILSEEEIIAQVERLVAAGVRRKEAAKEAALRTGLSAREIYALTLDS